MTTQDAQSRNLSVFEGLGKSSDFITALRQIDSSSKWWLQLSHKCKLRIVFCRQAQKEVLCVRSNFIPKATSREWDTFNSNRDGACCWAGNYWGTLWKLLSDLFCLVFKNCSAFGENLIWVWGFQSFKGVLAAVESVCLSLLLGHVALKKEAFVFGPEMLKKGSQTCCLGPFLLQD